ncbi:MAG: hypothetical protein K9N21_04045 [Deltaproteobacteria bacterium]|nr:hypothetical protein [Deltaproteobacteria bacterium]
MGTTRLPQKAFCSWSGGKDSCLALGYARQAGYDVAVLLNMLAEDGEYSRSHGLQRGILEAQADAQRRHHRRITEGFGEQDHCRPASPWHGQTRLANGYHG